MTMIREDYYLPAKYQSHVGEIEIFLEESLTVQISSAFCPCCLPSEVGFA